MVLKQRNQFDRNFNFLARKSMKSESNLWNQHMTNPFFHSLFENESLSVQNFVVKTCKMIEITTSKMILNLNFAI